MSTHAVEHPSSHFREIPRDECEALLGDQSTGRVAWNAPDGPQILPVTYGMYAGDIVFRTSPYGVLAATDPPHGVAFEIDDIDQAHGAGWSVLVRGRAKAVMAPPRTGQPVDPAGHRAVGSGHSQSLDRHLGDRRSADDGSRLRSPTDPVGRAALTSRGCATPRGAGARRPGWCRRRDPGWTTVSSAKRAKILLSRSSISEVKSSGLPVLPGPPGNRLSPVNRWVLPPAAYARVIDPGVWPTSPITSSDSEPSSTRSPSQTGTSPSTPVPSAMASRSGWPQTSRAPVAAATAGSACQWSPCRCVVTMVSSRRRR